MNVLAFYHMQIAFQTVIYNTVVKTITHYNIVGRGTNIYFIVAAEPEPPCRYCRNKANVHTGEYFLS